MRRLILNLRKMVHWLWIVIRPPTTPTALERARSVAIDRMKQAGARNVDAIRIEVDENGAARLVSNTEEEDPERALIVANASPYRVQVWQDFKNHIGAFIQIQRQTRLSTRQRVFLLLGALAAGGLYFWAGQDIALPMDLLIFLSLPILVLAAVLFALTRSSVVTLAALLEGGFYALPALEHGGFLQALKVVVIGFALLIPVVWAALQEENILSRFVIHLASRMMLGLAVLILPFVGLIALYFRVEESRATFAAMVQQALDAEATLGTTPASGSFPWFLAMAVTAIFLSLFLVRKLLQDAVKKSRHKKITRMPAFQALVENFQTVLRDEKKDRKKERQLHEVIREEVLLLETIVREYNLHRVFRNFRHPSDSSSPRRNQNQMRRTRR